MGIHDALDTLAKIVTKHPESVDLFSKFLDKKINLQILGWLVRIPESASQYAQKLLSLNYQEKKHQEKIEEIATKLVEGYKDHGFVIDFDEAKSILGAEMGEQMIKINTDVINKIEIFYSKLSAFEFFANLTWNQDKEGSLQADIVGEPSCRISTARRKL